MSFTPSKITQKSLLFIPPLVWRDDSQVKKHWIVSLINVMKLAFQILSIKEPSFISLLSASSFWDNCSSYAYKYISNIPNSGPSIQGEKDYNKCYQAYLDLYHMLYDPQDISEILDIVHEFIKNADSICDIIMQLATKLKNVDESVQYPPKYITNVLKELQFPQKVVLFEKFSFLFPKEEIAMLLKEEEDDDEPNPQKMKLLSTFYQKLVNIVAYLKNSSAFVVYFTQEVITLEYEHKGRKLIPHVMKVRTMGGNLRIRGSSISPGADLNHFTFVSSFDYVDLYGHHRRMHFDNPDIELYVHNYNSLCALISKTSVGYHNAYNHYQKLNQLSVSRSRKDWAYLQQQEQSNRIECGKMNACIDMFSNILDQIICMKTKIESLRSLLIAGRPEGIDMKWNREINDCARDWTIFLGLSPTSTFYKKKRNSEGFGSGDDESDENNNEDEDDNNNNNDDDSAEKDAHSTKYNRSRHGRVMNSNNTENPNNSRDTSLITDYMFVESKGYIPIHKDMEVDRQTIKDLQGEYMNRLQDLVSKAISQNDENSKRKERVDSDSTNSAYESLRNNLSKLEIFEKDSKINNSFNSSGEPSISFTPCERFIVSNSHTYISFGCQASWSQFAKHDVTKCEKCHIQMKNYMFNDVESPKLTTNTGTNSTTISTEYDISSMNINSNNMDPNYDKQVFKSYFTDSFPPFMNLSYLDTLYCIMNAAKNEVMAIKRYSIASLKWQTLNMNIHEVPQIAQLLGCIQETFLSKALESELILEKNFDDVYAIFDDASSRFTYASKMYTEIIQNRVIRYKSKMFKKFDNIIPSNCRIFTFYALTEDCGIHRLSALKQYLTLSLSYLYPFPLYDNLALMFHGSRQNLRMPIFFRNNGTREMSVGEEQFAKYKEQCIKHLIHLQQTEKSLNKTMNTGDKVQNTIVSAVNSGGQQLYKLVSQGNKNSQNTQLENTSAGDMEIPLHVIQQQEQQQEEEHQQLYNSSSNSSTAGGTNDSNNPFINARMSMSKRRTFESTNYDCIESGYSDHLHSYLGNETQMDAKHFIKDVNEDFDADDVHNSQDSQQGQYPEEWRATDLTFFNNELNTNNNNNNTNYYQKAGGDRDHQDLNLTSDEIWDILEEDPLHFIRDYVQRYIVTPLLSSKNGIRNDTCIGHFDSLYRASQGYAIANSSKVSSDKQPDGIEKMISDIYQRIYSKPYNTERHLLETNMQSKKEERCNEIAIRDIQDIERFYSSIEHFKISINKLIYFYVHTCKNVARQIQTKTPTQSHQEYITEICMCGKFEKRSVIKKRAVEKRLREGEKEITEQMNNVSTGPGYLSGE